MSEDFTNRDGSRSLERFAKSGEDEDANRVPAVIPQRAFTLAGQTIVGAQPVAVMRDEVKILQRLRELAAAKGAEFYYRYPVKDKGATKYIEGASIKLANAVAQIYGNCSVTCQHVIDIGDYWMIHATFVDYETGYSLTRPWQQPKTGSRLGGDDEDRRQGISLQIGVSKAERNVIVNALQIYTDFAFQEARSAMVDEIGRDLPGWREKARGKLVSMDVLARAEAIVGKSLKDWLAPDLARIRAMVVAIDDGMAGINDTFPPLPSEKVEPKKSGVADFGGETMKTDAPAQQEAATEEVEEDIVFGKPPAEEVTTEVVDFKGEKVLAAAITSCKSLKDLRDLWDANVQPFEEKMGPEIYGRLSKAANDRKKALQRAAQASAKK